MMGRGGVGQPNEVLDIGGLLELVGDDQRYKAKLQELQAQVTEANRVREIAVQTNMKAEDNRRAVREMLEQAKTARAETAAIKAENERAIGEIERRDRDLEAKNALLVQNITAFNQMMEKENSKLAFREHECQRRETLAEAVEDRASQVMEQAKLEATKLEKESSEASLAVRGAASAALAEAEKIKQESLRIKDVIAKKHTRYNEFVRSLAAEQ